MLLALAVFDTGRYGDAEQEFRTMKSLYADKPAAQMLPDYYIGLCLAHQNKPEAAQIALEEALLLNDASLKEEHRRGRQTKWHREMKENIVAALQDLQRSPSRLPDGKADTR